MAMVLSRAAELAGPGATTAALCPELVARFVAGRPAGESAHTTRTYLRTLGTACNYAAMRGYVRGNPMKARRQWVRPSEPRRTRVPTREEIVRVLELLRADAETRRGWAQWRARRLYALASVAAYTGMRAGEALRLCVADIDLDGRMLAIVARGRDRLKTPGSAQPVPIAEPLAGVLADWLAHRLDAPTTAAGVPDAAASRPRREGCPWLFPNTLRTGPWVGGSAGQKPVQRLKAAGLRAGVQGFTFLSLRHAFATHAEFWGLSPAMIQRILRHTSLGTQRHYRHADLANLRAVAGKIRFDGTGEAP
jgi:integrase